MLLSLGFIVGAFWFLIYIVQGQLDYQLPEDENFMLYFDLNEDSSATKMSVFTYYSITTLSTVGLGDYHPRSNLDRIISTILMFSGVTVFSFIYTKLFDAFENFKVLLNPNMRVQN